MTRTQRVWMIIQLLKEAPRTVDELANRFDVSHRTIRGDLLLIQTAPFYLNAQRRVIYTIEPVC